MLIIVETLGKKPKSSINPFAVLLSNALLAGIFICLLCFMFRRSLTVFIEKMRRVRLKAPFIEVDIDTHEEKISVSNSKNN